MKLPIHSAFYFRRELALTAAALMAYTVAEMAGKEITAIEGVTKLNLSEFEIKTVLAILNGQRELCKIEGVTERTTMSRVYAALRRLGYKFTLSKSSNFCNETIRDFNVDSEKLDLIDRHFEYICEKSPNMEPLLLGCSFNSCVDAVSE